MNLIKKAKKALLTIIILFLFTFIYTLLIYFNILKTESLSFKIVTLLIGILTFFLITLSITNNIKTQGWIKGLLVGILLLIVPLILTIVNKGPFNLSLILKFCIYLSFAVIAGIINVNKNKEK